MKYILTLILFANSLGNLATSAEPIDIEVVNAGHIDLPEKSFWVKGEVATDFLEAMFSSYPQTRRTGYMHKFKNISIKPILGSLVIDIYEGVYGKGENGNSYFNTFVNEKYRAERVERMTENETLGIIIYVKKNGATAKHIVTEAETMVFCDFIRNLCAQ